MWARGSVVTVGLGRSWCVGHGHLRFTRFFSCSSGRAATLIRDVRRRRQAPPQVKLRHSLAVPARGSIRQRRRRETERRRAGKRRVELTQRQNSCFSDQNRECEDAFFFWDRGRRGTDWKGVATKARAKERANWAKAMRRPWRMVAGRHTKTHDRRAHNHESSSHRFFFLNCFTRQ